MNKEIATSLADTKLKEVIQWDTEKILKLLEEPILEEIEKSRTLYQVRTSAFWEDKKNGQIRVNVAVDDGGFWSTLHPLVRSDFISISKDRNQTNMPRDN